MLPCWIAVRMASAGARTTAPATPSSASSASSASSEPLRGGCLHPVQRRAEHPPQAHARRTPPPCRPYGAGRAHRLRSSRGTGASPRAAPAPSSPRAPAPVAARSPSPRYTRRAPCARPHRTHQGSAHRAGCGSERGLRVGAVHAGVSNCGMSCAMPLVPALERRCPIATAGSKADSCAIWRSKSAPNPGIPRSPISRASAHATRRGRPLPSRGPTRSPAAGRCRATP